jgi:hypothetical protein
VAVWRSSAALVDQVEQTLREKQEVLAAFGAEKGEVTAGSQPGTGQLAQLALSRA